jgi:CheY-like chemotaxis protein
LKILVVDDDQELCKLLSRFFERHGMVVYSAGDALQALDVLGRVKVDFIITDLMMPHMDGLRFVASLKADPAYQDTPIVLLTAYPSEEILEKSLRMGASMALPKPIDFDRLLNLVRFAQ